MRTRVVSLALALLATLAVAALAPAASYAGGSGTVAVNDRVGDVRTPVLKRKHVFHLTSAQKHSIDIRRVTFQRVGGDVRINVALRKVLRPKAFDQMVQVTWRESGRGAWTGDVFVDSRRWRGSASYYGPGWDDYVNCNARTAVSTRYNTVAIVVPYRCVPVGPLSVRVEALTGKAQSDAPVPSWDDVRLPGRPVFDPA